MATVALPTACDANLSQTMAYERDLDNTHVRDVSFSSYLSNTEETFVLKFAELTPNPSPTITAPQEPWSHYQINLGRKKTKGEIGVFGAERYFNGGMDDDTPRIVGKVGEKQHQRDQRPNVQFVKPKTKNGTPSTCSEVSWNSQTALLPSFLRNQSPNKQIKLQGKRFFSSFGCNCTCSDKKSIDVEENVDKKMITTESIKTDQAPVDLVGIRVKQTQFKKDILCEKFDNLCLSMVEVEEKEKPRKSLDVFGSPIRELKLNQERELNMLTTFNAISKIKDNPANPRDGIYELDMESDASSDLFEIESLSGNTQRCLTRQASDSMSSCVTPTCYEPSEASIAWSVVTASAANFSTISDNDEGRSVSSAIKNSDMTSTRTTATMNKKKTTSTSAKERRPSLLLSGCRSHKAVKVAVDAYKMSEKRPNPNIRRREGLSEREADTLAPIARFQAEPKAIDFESANRNWEALTSRLLPQSNLARDSHLLYMN